MLDLVIRDATLASGRRVDVGVFDQRIAIVGEAGALDLVGNNHIDARGLHLLPGIIDPHVHLNWPVDGDVADMIATETAAAAAGGITTICHYPLGVRGALIEHLEETIGLLQAHASVDVVISYPILNDSHLGEMDELFERGVTSFKIQRSYRPPDVYDFGGVDDALLYRAMSKVANMRQNGQRALLKLHCENVDIYKVFKDDLQGRFPDLGRDSALVEMTWAHCRPSIVEAESVASALYLSRATNCPIMIVHLSAGMSLDPIREARRKGVRAWIETTPLYLETDAYHTGAPDGPLWTRVQPSVKFQEDAEALWAAVVDGTIDVIGTDHAAVRKSAYAGKSVWDHGASGRSLLGILLPLMLDAVSRGRMSLARLEEVMCEGPARVLGLGDHQGKIDVGLDANLVLCDLSVRRQVTVEMLHSRADHSPFEGRTLQGWPVATILRGQVIWNEGQSVSARHGQFLAASGIPSRPREIASFLSYDDEE